MKGVVDLTGQRFGKLVAQKQGRTIWFHGGTRITWVCLCDCGNEKIVRSGDLRKGDVRSCGCLKRRELVPPGHCRCNGGKWTNCKAPDCRARRNAADREWRAAKKDRDAGT